ncbi:hypothetical protein [Pedobacter sp. FW305-3-2-15-E-R2A2]|jgi:hypothetical protein|uniref:hypothetical protein n=1 Tax=Pedobacter sp. FW305-3-2-15-E-R2A2 TaxID=3140251 RepID=UPI0031409313
MLNLKNAQTLSRTDMKKFTGGLNDDSARRPCLSDCFYDPNNWNTCLNGGDCQIYYCGPNHDRDFGYKCQ